MRWTTHTSSARARSDRRSPLRGRVGVVLVLLIGLLIVPASQAVLSHGHAAASKRPGGGGLRTPSLQSPRNGASVQSLPSFTWASVAKATAYQFQLSADRHFASVVQSFVHKGSIET